MSISGLKTHLMKKDQKGLCGNVQTISKWGTLLRTRLLLQWKGGKTAAKEMVGELFALLFRFLCTPDWVATMPHFPPFPGGMAIGALRITGYFLPLGLHNYYCT